MGSPPSQERLTLPDTMRAVLLTEHGGLEALHLRDVPRPEPGTGEVLVRVGAAGCNNTDLWTREGAYGSSDDPEEKGGWKGPVDFPRIQGADVAGTVVAVGSGVPTTRIGSRVLVDPARYDGDGPDALVDEVLGSEHDGGFAEYVVVADEQAHDVGDTPLRDVELASLPIAYGTALGMLERGQVGAGHAVLVTGASGGVGLAAVQLCSARGADVVAVCSGDKAEGVREAGAADVVDRTSGPVGDQARHLRPEGYDVVVDVVAGPQVGRSLSLLRPGGRWVVAGALDGWAVEIDVRRLYLANLALVGSTMHTRRVFAKLVEIARAGQVRPVVAQTFPLDQLAAAQETLARRRHVGKLVVVP